MAVGDGQFAAQGRQRVAVAGGRRVRGDAKLPGDLGKGEAAPNLEREHLALLGRQPPQGGLDRHPPVVALRKGLEEGGGVVAQGASLAGHAPDPAAPDVEARPANRGKQKRQGLAGKPALAPPEADEGVLNDVLSVGHRRSPLPRAKEQLRAVAAKPVVPGLILGDFLHRGLIGWALAINRRRRLSILSDPGKKKGPGLLRAPWTGFCSAVYRLCDRFQLTR